MAGISLDGAIIKVHLDGTGALKNGQQTIGKSRGRWSTKIHMSAADDKTIVAFSLSPGQSVDMPESRNLLRTMENFGWEGASVIKDKAYEGDDTSQLILYFGMTPVPPMINRCRRNIIENIQEKE